MCVCVCVCVCCCCVARGRALYSLQALNDLFEKIMCRDIKEGDLVRLGQGERDLDTDADYSKWGRVSASLELRMKVLAEVTVHILRSITRHL